VKESWRWEADELKTNLDALARQVRLLTAAVEALAQRVKALEGGDGPGPPGKDA
jgi:hypothetical protein